MAAPVSASVVRIYKQKKKTSKQEHRRHCEFAAEEANNS
jgi:hypothetical protein